MKKKDGRCSDLRGFMIRAGIFPLGALGLFLQAYALSVRVPESFDGLPLGPKDPGDCVVSGAVEVIDAGVGRSHVLCLRSGTPPGQIGYDIADFSPGVRYVDFLVRARAAAADIQFVDADGALIALKSNGDGTASWRVYDGLRNAASGVWLTVGSPVPLSVDATPASFSRVTLRINRVSGKFDVLIDGALVAFDFTLADPAVSSAATLDFYAPPGSDTHLDDVLVTDIVPERLPRYAFSRDLNGNGLPDDWEVEQGWSITPGVVDPEHGFGDDFDSDGLKNADEFNCGTAPGVADTDGDGMNDGDEIAAGRNPLLPDAPADSLWIRFTAKAKPVSEFGWARSSISFHSGMDFLQFLRVDEAHGRWYWAGQGAAGYGFIGDPVLLDESGWGAPVEFVMYGHSNNEEYTLFMDGVPVVSGSSMYNRAWGYSEYRRIYVRNNDDIRILSNDRVDVLMRADLNGNKLPDVWELGKGLSLFPAVVEPGTVEWISAWREFWDGVPPPPFVDVNGDGLLDAWEISFGWFVSEYWESWGPVATDDPDRDGLGNALEHVAGTNPTLADTDGDGMNDGDEIAAGRNPLGADSVEEPGADTLWFHFTAQAKPAGTGIVWGSSNISFHNGMDFLQFLQVDETHGRWYWAGQGAAGYGFIGDPVLLDESGWGAPVEFTMCGHTNSEDYTLFMNGVPVVSGSSMYNSGWGTYPESRRLYISSNGDIRFMNGSRVDVILRRDTNGNKLPDGWETSQGWALIPAVTQPGDMNWISAWNAFWGSLPPPAVVDENGNGLSDVWEATQGWTVTPGVIEYGRSAVDDPDGDGLTNLDEFNRGTAPGVADTDGDGMNDGDEIAAGRDPLSSDTPVVATDADGDGLPDADESTLTQTDPYNAYSVSPDFNDSYGAKGYVAMDRWTGFSALPQLAEFHASGAIANPAGAGLTRSRALRKSNRIEADDAGLSGPVVTRVCGWITPQSSGDAVLRLTTRVGAVPGGEVLLALSADDQASGAKCLLHLLNDTSLGVDSPVVSVEAGRRYYYELWRVAAAGDGVAEVELASPPAPSVEP